MGSVIDDIIDDQKVNVKLKAINATHMKTMTTPKSPSMSGLDIDPELPITPVIKQHGDDSNARMYVHNRTVAKKQFNEKEKTQKTIAKDTNFHQTQTINQQATGIGSNQYTQFSTSESISQ